MTITTAKDGTKLTMALEGRLDTNTAPELEAALSSSLDGISELEFDFAELIYISSAGLRVLLSAQKRMASQGRMVVKHVNDIVSEILEVTGFSEILTIE